MAQKLYEETNIQAIADAIREKNGATDTYLVSEMAEAISAIEAGGGGGLDLSTLAMAKIYTTSGTKISDGFDLSAYISDSSQVKLLMFHDGYSGATFFMYAPDILGDYFMRSFGASGYTDYQLPGYLTSANGTSSSVTDKYGTYYYKIKWLDATTFTGDRYLVSNDTASTASHYDYGGFIKSKTNITIFYEEA